MRKTLFRKNLVREFVMQTLTKFTSRMANFSFFNCTNVNKCKYALIINSSLLFVTDRRRKGQVDDK